MHLLSSTRFLRKFLVANPRFGLEIGLMAVILKLLTSSRPLKPRWFQESLLRSFCFIATAIRLMSIRSYVRSTDFHRKPCGKNILCGVNIPIVVYPTMGTIPFTDIQRQFFNDVPTVVTPFRTRKPSVNLDQCATIPLTLVLKLSDQLTPTRIADREGKFPVLHHILHSQILNSNRLVFAYQSSCQLVKKILSGISNFLMHFCDLEPRLISIVRSLLLATQRLLSFLELATFCIKGFGVYNLF